MPDGRVVASEVGSGPPVVLVHGGTGTGEHDWAAVRQHLAADRRVVTLDLRGHGRSRNEGGELATRRFAADLPHVLTRYGIRCADMVGFSLGANTVLDLLCRRPEWATRAVLVGGSATGQADRVRRMAASPVWPKPLRLLRHEVDPSPDYWRRLRGVLLEDWATHTEVDAQMLARVRCPVLVVNGREDPIQRPEVAAHLARSLPCARLELIEGAGHAVHLDQPARFLALLDGFLTPIGSLHAR